MRFYRLQSVFISMKICIDVADVVMTLHDPAESVMLRVVITEFMTCRYLLNNSNVIFFMIKICFIHIDIF